MSNRSILLAAVFAGFLFPACQKETAIQNYEFAEVYVSYRKFIGYYPVNIYLNDKNLGKLDVDSADYLKAVVPVSDAPATLAIKRTDGTLLFDTSFVPQMSNNFTLLISEDLGLAQFDALQAIPPDAQHMRMQLFHKIVVNGVQHPKVDFKFFTRNTLPGSFTATPYELKNVEFGKLSGPIDLPVLGTPGVYYYIRTYDSQTGELLLDLWEDYNDGIIRYSTGGKSVVVNVRTDDYPPDGAFYNLLDVYEW